MIIVAKGRYDTFGTLIIFSNEDAMNHKMMGKFLSQILIIESRVYHSGTFDLV